MSFSALSDEIEYPTGGTSSNFTLPLAANGILPGDIVIVNVTTNTNAAALASVPGGVVTIYAMGSMGADALSSGAYYYIVPATPPASLTWTWTTARRGTLAWSAIRGADPDDPVNALWAGAWESTFSTSHVADSITTTTDGCALVVGMAVASGSGNPVYPASPSWTVLTNAAERDGSMAWRTQATAGATGTVAVSTAPDTYRARMFQLALNALPVDPPVEATLTSETYPGFSGDVADGAAIVYDSASPSSSVVITTNKDVGGGLYVLGLDGQIMSSALDGAANSVDWRDLTGVAGWDDRLLVMTSDREDNLLRFYWMNRTTKALASAGSYALGWEPYGTCLYVHSTGQVYAFVTQRGPDDVSPRNMYQFPIARSGETVATSASARTVALSSVVEGLAADDVTGYLFASEEDVGLYRYSASPSGGSSRTAVDTVGGGHLVADVEDVAVARTAEGAYLLVSSQGDSTYHVYDLATLAHLQSFTVDRPGGGDQVTSTDGLDVYLGNFGSGFPNGLIVVHDGDRTPISDFAFVDAGLVFGELPTPAVTAAFAGSGSLSATATSAVARTAAFTGSGNLSATVETAVTPQRAAAFAGSGSLTATVRVAVAAPFAGAGVLSASVSSAWARMAAFSGDGALSAVVTSRIARTAAFTGSGSLSAVASTPGVVTAAFTGVGVLSAVVESVAPVGVAADFAGRGVLTAETSAVYTFTVFRPPTVTERWPVDDRFLRRLTKQTGTTVLKSADGLYRQIADPSDEEIAGAEVAYLGGHVHRVDDAEAAALIEAGYGEYLSTEEVFV